MKGDFGVKIKEIRNRQNPKVTLMELSKVLDINKTLLNDVENGKKNASVFSTERIERFAEYMKLDEDEKFELYNLQSKESNRVPEYIKNVMDNDKAIDESIQKAFRIISSKKNSDRDYSEEFKRFVESLEKKNND